MPDDLPRVPGTAEGLDAFSGLVASGTSAVIGPLFSLERCDQALDSYFAGMERLLGQGGNPDGVWVVEFAAADLGSAVDRILKERARSAPESVRAAYRLLEGRIGAASAAVARLRFERGLNSVRFEALKARGAPRPEMAPRAEWSDYGAAKRLVDKLANYQIDLEMLGAQLERREVEAP